MNENERALKSGRIISVNNQNQNVFIKCDVFLEKSAVRLYLKRYLKEIDAIKKIKVSAISKRAYRLTK